ncbi:MAG: glycerate kinase [Clostridia bacterium]|nr:glycerate kinase [Clostridia bacterium]
MNILIAIDSFKGSMTSLEAGEAAAEGIRRVIPDAHITVAPLADGGEGTVEALTAGLGGSLRTVRADDPLGRPVDAAYGILPGNVAVIEMAAASGLPLLKAEERNPSIANTRGVGQLIAHAMGEGCRDFIIGIGGSATNDGGVGMLEALGFGFFDIDGHPIAPCAAGLASLASIDRTSALPALKECRFRVACDVKNPLCGESGCSAVFGPQKGATPEMVTQMDGWLEHYASIAGGDPNLPGNGAAGGLGYALRTFLGAELESGVSLILDATKFADRAADADVVITGEGRLDAQTVMGKAPQGVASLAKAAGKLCIAFAGCVTRDASACNSAGIDAFFPIVRGACTLEEAMDPKNARRNMADTVEQAFRLMSACQTLSCSRDR